MNMDMKVTVEDVSPIEKRLSVEIPPDVVTAALDRAYRKIGSTASIKGFRKGKAPRSVLERYYAPRAEEDAIKDIIDQSLSEALKQVDATLILEPLLSSVSPVKVGEPFTYALQLDLWPEFELPRYKGIELERPVVEVTDAEVDEQLEALRRHFGTIEPVEDGHVLSEGDIAVIDYSGKVEGEDEPVVSEKGYYFELGKGYVHPEFDRELAGLSKGAAKTFDVSYPEDAVNARLAGKTLRYSVEIKDIRRRVLPDLDDAFAQRFGSAYPTMKDLKERMRGQIEADKKNAADRMIRSQILKKLAAAVDFAVPERLVAAKLDQMIDNISSHLNEKGLDLDAVGMSEDRLKERLREDAIFQVKTEIILDRIAELERIYVENDELKVLAGKYEIPQDMDAGQVADAVVRHVLPKLRAKKTLDFLIAEAHISDAPRAAGVTESAAAADQN
ncbi:MAG: trigger factor [Deltaproteobacteria bacterium]